MITAEAIEAGLKGSGGESIALLGVDVRADVVAGHACAVVRQRYKNSEPKPIEAIYTFPLPSKAVLIGFSMTVDGRRVEGEVHEREEAFKRYDDAITAGHGGALLDQERPNVFTASVGNLLPGEETIIEVQYVEPVLADEGAVRWSIPTLVAPRYITGIASGDRTAHGTADPTNRVPDADRISPPMGNVAYGLALDLTFDLGVPVTVESPSHRIVIQELANKTRVTFAQREVALDRDVVVTAFAKDASSSKIAPIASALTHRKPKSDSKENVGVLALTLVPDLGAAVGQAKRDRRNDVVFVLDRSGSMGGSSMTEARTALRLCLRQLREGDRFNILAFDDSIETFDSKLVPFGQATLQKADAWLNQVDARGGTELLEPVLEAIKLAPHGVVVLLTDGEVGNEDEILKKALEKRTEEGKGSGSVTTQTRFYSFGIGTNVSDVLLRSLADQTGGAVEMIHPGERIDEKVVAQFARATAPRVTDITIKTRGIELGEFAPSDARPLVDGEPWCLFATYEEAGRGAIEIRGKLDGGEPFYLEVPVDLDADSDRPFLPKLWAQARIVDLERAIVTGRRADSMRDRIIKLAKEHGVSSKYTSFVVIEKRTGDRRVNEQAATRVVPVNVPAGWDMLGSVGAPATTTTRSTRSRGHGFGGQTVGGTGGGRPMKKMKAAIPARGGIQPRSMPSPVTMRHSPMKDFDMAKGGGPGAPPPPPAASAPAPSSFGRMREESMDGASFEEQKIASADLADLAEGGEMMTIESEVTATGNLDPIFAILSGQNAAGLWEKPGRSSVDVTVEMLVALLRLGVTSTHAVFGAQVKKAIDALLAYVQNASNAASITPATLELALGVAWLLASGRRTRSAIEDRARQSSDQFGALIATLGNEPAVRAHVDRLSPASV